MTLNTWPLLTKRTDVLPQGLVKSWSREIHVSSWRHQMETFSALLALCAGNSPVTGEFPAQRPVTRRFDVFFDLSLNKRLSKQPRRWWFETPSCSLWRHCDVDFFSHPKIWQASWQQPRNACEISERYDHYNIQSCGFKTSRHEILRQDVRPLSQ